MTILHMSDSDELHQEPPAKKRCLSSNRSKTKDNKSCSTWVNDKPSSPRVSFQMPGALGTMFNGYGLSDSFPHSQGPMSQDECVVVPVAPLVNVGNTCFLNSVLYTLRFAPMFLHKLHHLNLDSENVLRQANLNRHSDKGCVIEKNGGKFGTWSGRDEFSWIPPCFNTKVQTVSRLHQLYCALFTSEIKDRVEPVQPNTFVHCLREVNPFFEGNQQQDAHELLVCVLDVIREVCEVVYHENNTLGKPLLLDMASANNSLMKSMKQKIFKKRLRKANNSDGDIKKYLTNGNTNDERESGLFGEDHFKTKQNSIIEDFRGVSLLRTTCLECEQVTERKETFCDICVPVETVEDYKDEESVDRLYRSIIVTEEYLIDCNKYWCEKCSRYNEARRSVRYETLPRLLTLHLKRFSSNFGATVQKLTNHMPTPFTLSCFCEECLCIENGKDRPHYYTLYAFITHCGTTLASGHYVAVVKATDSTKDYKSCKRDKVKTSSLSRSSSSSTTSSFSNSASMFDKSANGLSKLILNKLSSKSFNCGHSKSKEPDLDMIMTTSCKGLECCSLRLCGVPSMDQDSNDVWLQCDDEKIEILPSHKLLDMLSPVGSEGDSKTPYLLFYSRVDAL